MPTQVLDLVLGHQVLVLVLESPSLWQQHWICAQ